MNSVLILRRMEWCWIMVAAVLICVSEPSWSAGNVSAERGWIKHAETLVAMAKGHADAAGFEWAVEQSRQRLREIVGRAGPHPAPARRQLYVSMILLNALLESAAKCQQAGHVVCSTNLIWQLDSQVKTANAQLEAMAS